MKKPKVKGIMTKRQSAQKYFSYRKKRAGESADLCTETRQPILHKLTTWRHDTRGTHVSRLQEATKTRNAAHDN